MASAVRHGHGAHPALRIGGRIRGRAGGGFGSRVGLGCGATFTAANLAVSLARQETCRTVLLDLDMRAPSLHQTLGVAPNTQAGAFLRGELAPEHHLIRLGQDQFHTRRNLAFGFNAAPESYPAETLQDPRARAALEALEARFRPDVMLFDLPPVLDNDDVIAMRPLFDGVLLVLGGGITTERQVKEVERRLGEQTPLLGMILNKAEGVTPGA